MIKNSCWQENKHKVTNLKSPDADGLSELTNQIDAECLCYWRNPGFKLGLVEEHEDFKSNSRRVQSLFQLIIFNKIILASFFVNFFVEKEAAARFCLPDWPIFSLNWPRFSAWPEIKINLKPSERNPKVSDIEKVTQFFWFLVSFFQKWGRSWIECLKSPTKRQAKARQFQIKRNKKKRRKSWDKLLERMETLLNFPRTV